MYLRTLLVLFFAAFIPASLFGQTDSNESAEGQRTVFDIRSEGGNKYLKVLNELKTLESDDRIQQAMKTAVMVPIASFMAPNSEYESLLRQHGFRFRADSLLTQVKKHGYTGMDNLKRVLGEEISNRNLVMFSEFHYYPHHRILIEKLLPLFSEAGYNYLALEALTHGQDSLLNEGNPPTIHTGFYTKDPRFANLIRTAQSLDFTLIPYENMDRERDREEGQAANLYAATYAEDPDARVLVLAGMDHILEQPTLRGKKWLGTVLNEQYQLDPLSIGQHHLRYFERFVSDVTFVKTDIFETRPLNSVDYQLINPLPLVEEQTNFHFTNEYEEQVQLSIYLQHEYSAEFNYNKLIPIQSRLLEAGETIPLTLPEKNLQLIVYDKEGDVLKSYPTDL